MSTREPVWIDPRVGSRELYADCLTLGLPVDLVPLANADVAFVGRGPTGPATVGIERKRISDLAQSLVSERLQGGQLPRLLAYDFRWLVVEGVWREGASGYIEVPDGRDWRDLQPRLLFAGVESWLLSLELRGGVRVHRTRRLEDTCAWLSTLYRWWTEKDWFEHQGHLSDGTVALDASMFDQPSFLFRVASQIPGVARVRAEAIAAMFATLYDLVTAGVELWEQIPGIGKDSARRIVHLLTQGESSPLPPPPGKSSSRSSHRSRR